MLIFSSGLSDENSLAPLQTKAAFRKASKKMMLAYASIANTMAHQELPNEILRNSALVLNSGFGEIEATGGFLKAFAESGVARPLLFQNSLHNSTTGFLAIQFGIQGPVFTVNHRTQGGAEATEIASTLLEENLCEFCFVVTTETVPPEFVGETGIGHEGAAALILTTANACSKYSLHPFGGQLEAQTLASVAMNEELSKISKINLPLKGLRSLLEFDAIFRIANRLVDSKIGRLGADS
jgi:hypothetical protein